MLLVFYYIRLQMVECIRIIAPEKERKKKLFGKQFCLPLKHWRNCTHELMQIGCERYIGLKATSKIEECCKGKKRETRLHLIKVNISSFQFSFMISAEHFLNHWRWMIIYYFFVACIIIALTKKHRNFMVSRGQFIRRVVLLACAHRMGVEM